jgi:hypothetical protein
LLGYASNAGTRGPPRQIFRSVISNQGRKKLMMSLLELASINKDKEQFYDEVIDEFSKLSGVRNEYLHGLWYTHKETGRVFLAEESLDDFYFFDRREVTEEEIVKAFDRMAALYQRVAHRHRRELRKDAPSSSPETQPRQRAPSTN